MIKKQDIHEKKLKNFLYLIFLTFAEGNSSDVICGENNSFINFLDNRKNE
jgi:hypothetical protein